METASRFSGGCEHGVGICHCGADDSDTNVGPCVTCSVEAPLTDDLCATCHALPLPGCNCGCNAVPVAVEDANTTPIPRLTDADLLAEFRAVRS